MDRQIEALKTLLGISQGTTENVLTPGYIYDDGAGNVYICYPGNDGIVYDTAKWMVKRIRTSVTGTDIAWAKARDYVNAIGTDATTEANIPAVVAALTYIHCK